MSDEIEVKVSRWGEGRPLSLRWTDPISGKRKAKSAGTTDWGEAERAAGELEKRLRAGEAVTPNRITWQQFRERYRAEKLSGMPETSQMAYRVALDHVTRVMDPERLANLTAQAMSRFIAKLRREGMKATTIARHLRMVMAALR